MKHAATMALMVTLSVTGVYAQQIPVNMRFSGDAGPSGIDLMQPNTNTGEENLAGYGTLSPFTFRLVEASTASPLPAGTCSARPSSIFPVYFDLSSHRRNRPLQECVRRPYVY